MRLCPVGIRRCCDRENRLPGEEMVTYRPATLPPTRYQRDLRFARHAGPAAGLPVLVLDALVWLVDCPTHLQK